MGTDIRSWTLLSSDHRCQLKTFNKAAARSFGLFGQLDAEGVNDSLPLLDQALSIAAGITRTDGKPPIAKQAPPAAAFPSWRKCA